MLPKCPARTRPHFWKPWVKVMQEERRKQKVSQESWYSSSGVDRAPLSQRDYNPVSVLVRSAGEIYVFP